MAAAIASSEITTRPERHFPQLDAVLAPEVALEHCSFHGSNPRPIFLACNRFHVPFRNDNHLSWALTYSRPYFTL
jgi:hypothetical protein